MYSLYTYLIILKNTVFLEKIKIWVPISNGDLEQDLQDFWPDLVSYYGLLSLKWG